MTNRRGVKKVSAVILATLILLNSVSAVAVSTSPTLEVKVTVVAPTCVIPAGEENIAVDFDTISAKEMYSSQRTPSREFFIHLTNCDTKIVSAAKVTFTGTEATGLPGLLTLDAGSSASGIAIGLETSDGTPQKLNQVSKAYKLTDGDNRINMKAYVQITPDALRNHSLNVGDFRATAVFNLEYE